jgi:hypothetical protein
MVKISDHSYPISNRSTNPNLKNNFIDKQKNQPVRTAHRLILLYISLLQNQSLEQQYPDQVNPTESQTEEGNQNTNDQADQTTLLEERTPANQQLGDPVHTGNEEQNNLYKTALSVKPSHNKPPKSS